MTKQEEKETLFYFVRFCKASTEAMDIFPFIEDYLDKSFKMKLDTTYMEKFTAKGKRLKELEKAHKEDLTRYEKRKKSFIKQWNQLVMNLDGMQGKFGNLFNEFVNEQHELNEKYKEKFSKLD